MLEALVAAWSVHALELPCKAAMLAQASFSMIQAHRHYIDKLMLRLGFKQCKVNG